MPAAQLKELERRHGGPYRAQARVNVATAASGIQTQAVGSVIGDDVGMRHVGLPSRAKVGGLDRGRAGPASSSGGGTLPGTERHGGGPPRGQPAEVACPPCRLPPEGASHSEAARTLAGDIFDVHCMSQLPAPVRRSLKW